MKTTKAYKRLPPDSGTPFEQEVHLSGFKGIKIESRVSAERQISDFLKYCENDAVQPAARMLLGAWGEGKTEAFSRYIKPQVEKKGHSAFLITAKSIVNALRYEQLDTSEARLFLGAIFHALADEGVVSHCSQVGFKQWIENCLRTLGCNKHKLFLFIDEVEQLLHEPVNLRRLMLGIKQILDGRFDALIPGGEFAGSVFIFFACTPEAYNRIATDPELRQVFGGYGRRMDQINIEQISLKEAVQFLYRLLNYSYNENIPKPYPISSPGILSALATIAKYNMGHMVSLTARLLSSMDRGNGTVEIIGADQLKSFSKGRTINIEGVDTKCFEDDLYNLIIQKLGEVEAGGEFYKQLLTTLLFDHKAFSAKDVSDILGKDLWKGMNDLWMEYFNKALAELSYTPGLLSFKLVESSLQKDSVFENLSSFADKTIITSYRFGDKLFTRSNIEDILTDWSFNKDGELLEHLLVPSNIETVQNLFGPLILEEAERLLNIFLDLSSSSETELYRLTKDIINEVFPPPCPPGLEFIQVASERFNLWRRATAEYSQCLQKDLPQALINLANMKVNNLWYFDTMFSSSLKGDIATAILIFEKEQIRKKVKLIAWVIARPFIVEDDMGLIYEQFELTSKPPHIIIFLSNDPPPINILDDIPNSIKKRSCFINIHPTYSKQMLATYWHIKSGGASYERLLQNLLHNLLNRDLGIYNNLDKWLINGRQSGFVVDNPTLSEGTHRELVSALRLLLNTYGKNLSLQEIDYWNRTVLRKLIPYGTKGGLVPDRFESYEGFCTRVGDLQRNGFIDIDTENRPIFRFSPCQEVILEELSRGYINSEEWHNYLVIIANPESILEELYVETLVQFGLVEKRAGRGRGQAKKVRVYQDRDTLCDKAIQQAKDYKQRIQNIAERSPLFLDLAHLAVAKERDVQVITLQEFTKTIDERIDAIHNPRDDLEDRINAYFLIRFIEQSGENLLVSSNETAKIIGEIKQSCSTRYNEYISQIIPNAISGVQQFLDLTMDISNLQEIIQLERCLDRVKEIIEHAKDDGKELIESKILSLDSNTIKQYFWHDSLDSEDIPHNYYAYLVLLIKKEFDNYDSRINRLLNTITPKVQGLEERKGKVYSRLTSHRVAESLVLSKSIFEKIKFLVQPTTSPINIPSGDIKVNSLEDLNSLIDNKLLELQHSIKSIEESCDLFERLNEAEEFFCRIFEKGKKILESTTSKFDLQDFNDAKKSLEELLEQANEEYKSLYGKINNVDPKNLEKIRRKLTDLREDVETIDKLIKENLWTPFSEKRLGLIFRINKLIDACSPLPDIPKELNEKRETLNQINQNESSLEEFLGSAYKCSEEINLMDEISSLAKEVLKKHLVDDELRTLNAIVELYDIPEADRGIEIDKLEAKVDNINRLELIKTLISLWEKGILSIKTFL